MRVVILSSLLASLALASSPARPPSYALETRFQLGGEGHWDYLAFDEHGQRLFVTRGDRVEVLDAHSGKLLHTIDKLFGVHGVALAPALNRGFISDGKGNSVAVFDLKTLVRGADIAVPGENPDAILYEPSAKRVLTFNGRSKNATVIDAKSLKVLGTIALPGKPEFAVADGKGNVFVNIEDTSQLVKLDDRARKVVATWELKPCEGPSGLAIDVKHARLFSVCDNKLMVVTDAKSGKQLAQVPIGEGPDAAAFDPSRGVALSSNGHDGTLTVVRESDHDHFEVAQTVATQKSARTMALDPKSGRIYLSAAELGDTPAPTSEQPHPRPTLKPDTFSVLVVGPAPAH